MKVNVRSMVAVPVSSYGGRWCDAPGLPPLPTGRSAREHGWARCTSFGGRRKTRKAVNGRAIAGPDAGLRGLIADGGDPQDGRGCDALSSGALPVRPARRAPSDVNLSPWGE